MKNIISSSILLSLLTLCLSGCSLGGEKPQEIKKLNSEQIISSGENTQKGFTIVGSCILEDIGLPGQKMCIESSQNEKENCAGKWSETACDKNGYSKKCTQITDVENGLTGEKYKLYTHNYTFADSKMQCAGVETLLE